MLEVLQGDGFTIQEQRSFPAEMDAIPAQGCQLDARPVELDRTRQHFFDEFAKAPVQSKVPQKGAQVV